MKKGTVLNSDISSVISRLGHTDTLVVCDAGLPIPKSTTRIDMALTQGVPSFMQVLGVVTNEMQVEAAIIAEEIKQHNPQLHETLLTHLEQLQKHQGNTIEIRYTTHEQFKQQTAESQAVIRSGECSPYANIILCVMEALLQLKGIDKAFPGVKALSGAALNVYPGRVMALVGENGAGKSTMMKVLTGIYTRDAGTLLWLGKETTFTGPKSSQEAGIGIIHQELNLIPQLTIAENIFLGREFVNRFGKIDWKTMYAEADKLLAKLNLRFKSDKLVGDLSIGDQQMVEIAKVLSFESKVIIMDEPTDALTDTETESLFRVIRELKSQGRGIVYISHRMKEIFEICDDVTVFRDGQFIAEREVASLTEDSLIEMMVGRKLEDQYPHLDKAPGDIRLKVDNLCGPGVNDVSFTLRKGEILGVSGLMGAGRTELMKVLYGALPRTSGYVTLDGHEVVTRSPQDGLANGIVYISEDRKRDGLVLGMSVKENMSLTALRYFSRTGGSLKHADEQQAVSDFIRLFNVKTPSMEQAIGLLSGGNQQKVAIARGLMTRPKVLILDEPTRGVDVGAKKEIYQLINQFKADGLSIILVSSEMPEVLGMSDRIIVMHEGHLSGEFTREQATQEVLMAAAVGKLNRVNQE